MKITLRIAVPLKFGDFTLLLLSTARMCAKIRAARESIIYYFRLLAELRAPMSRAQSTLGKKIW